MKKISYILLVCMFLQFGAGIRVLPAPQYQWDFENFKSSTVGNSLPTGWNVINGENGTNHIWYMDTDRGVSAGMSTVNEWRIYEWRYNFSSQPTTSFTVEYSIKMLDYNRVRGFAFRAGSWAHTIIKFQMDGSLMLFDERVDLSEFSYKLNNWYDVRFTYTPSTKKYEVDIFDGEHVFSKTSEYAVNPSAPSISSIQSILFNNIFESGFSGRLSDESSTLVDDIRVYIGDHDVMEDAFYMRSSFPADQKKYVSPNSKIFISFSKPIENDSFLENVTFGGRALSVDEVEVLDTGLCIITPSQSLFPDTSYLLKGDNIRDTIGNSLSFQVTFRTSPSIMLGSIRYSKNAIETGDITASVWAKSTTGEASSCVFLSVLYDAHTGGVVDVAYNHAFVSEEGGDIHTTLTLPGAEYFIESYLWDSVVSANIIGNKASLGASVPAGSKSDLTALYKAEVNFDNGDVEIYGKSDLGKAVIMVLKSGKTLTDLETVTKDNIMDIISYLKETEVADKGYNIKYRILDSEGAKYGLFLKTPNTAEPSFIPNAFQYFSKEEIKAVTDAFNDDNADYDVLIKENVDLLGLDLTDYNILDEEIDGVSLFLSKEKPFNSVESIANAFNKAVGVYLLASEKNASKIDGHIEKYGAILGMDKQIPFQWYRNISKVREDVADKFAKTNGFTTVKNVIDFFNEATVISAVYRSVIQADVHSVLTNNADLIGINLTDFEKLINQESVLKAIGGKDWGNYKNLSDAFKSEVAISKSNEYQKSQKSNSVTGGSTNRAPKQEVLVPNTPTTENPLNPTFDDLKAVPWAVESVEALAKRGIVNGVDEKNFAPMDKVTREQFVKMLVIAFDHREGGVPVEFTDVSMDMFYYPYLQAASNARIIYGKENGSFGIGENITREDLAVMAYRAAGIEISYKNFSMFADDRDISHYARNAVYAMKESGIINGKDENRFDPKAPATRAEAAKIIYMLLKKLEGEVIN